MTSIPKLSVQELLAQPPVPPAAQAAAPALKTHLDKWDAFTGCLRFCWFNTACWLTETHVPNFKKVSEQIYRGGQPSVEGIVQLHKRGISTLVNLRALAQDVNTPLIEKARVPIQSISIPFDPDVHDQAKGEAALITFLRQFNNPKNRPVYVHCYYGNERTGTFIAAYRVIFEGWTREAAIKELRSDPNFHEKRHPYLVQHILNLDVDKIKKELAKDKVE